MTGRKNVSIGFSWRNISSGPINNRGRRHCGGFQTERSRGRRRLMLGVGIYYLGTFRCFLIRYLKTLLAWVRIKEVFGWPSMTPGQSLNLRRSSHTSINCCSFSRAAHNFYSQQGLSLSSFSRIAKKERDACIQWCFEFSMHRLNHITD